MKFPPHRAPGLDKVQNWVWQAIWPPVRRHQAEELDLIHPGHYGGCSNYPNQEALVHPMSWIKREWTKGKRVGVLLGDGKSAFPSVHHPRLLDTLQSHPRMGYTKRSLLHRKGNQMPGQDAKYKTPPK
ncbi:hypothetical protein CROQUDRAFT_93486 [Cronartium quercuum f. sp. fusiforme G11]|uniref:Uncharacterized protein n=1 Tax=Cronartium quercuum f. sp. fusiforme G11 TaxID=708437 RepID=A0A9P6NKB5_9BASI|nr:hypothetical protein CROQUDRAFT_93486 [Cronartium quercuum f. sp. fusiforme G11]